MIFFIYVFFIKSFEAYILLFGDKQNDASDFNTKVSTSIRTHYDQYGNLDRMD